MTDTIESIWHGLGILTVASLLALLGVVFLADKHVDGYYLSKGTGPVCVYAHWTWHGDEAAYCTDKYQDALDFASKANASLPKYGK